MEYINKTTEIKRLHDLIDRYFEAATTDEEERELMKLLASTELSDNKIEEARAVAGFFAASRVKARRSSRPSHNRQWYRVAATIAIAVVCAAAIFLTGQKDYSENRCIAYIGEQEITDSDMVLGMMQRDLDEINEITSALRNDANAEIASISDVLTL